MHKHIRTGLLAVFLLLVSCGQPTPTISNSLPAPERQRELGIDGQAGKQFGLLSAGRSTERAELAQSRLDGYRVARAAHKDLMLDFRPDEEERFRNLSPAEQVATLRLKVREPGKPAVQRATGPEGRSTQALLWTLQVGDHITTERWTAGFHIWHQAIVTDIRANPLDSLVIQYPNIGEKIERISLNEYLWRTVTQNNQWADPDSWDMDRAINELIITDSALAFTREEVRLRAYGRWNMRDFELYDWVENNCQHLAYWARSGVSFSPQIRDMLWWLGEDGIGNYPNAPMNGLKGYYVPSTDSHIFDILKPPTSGINTGDSISGTILGEASSYQYWDSLIPLYKKVTRYPDGRIADCLLTTDAGEAPWYQNLGRMAWISPHPTLWLETGLGMHRPLHRLYHPAAGRHTYTTRNSERDYLVVYGGWIYEWTIGWLW